MDSLNLSKTLDRLCHAEQRSMLPRLRESVVFVSWASAEDADAVAGMIEQEQEHVAWLVEMILGLGETPTPCTADVHTTSMHYVELNYMMPRVIQSKRNSIGFYEQNAADVSSSAEASTLVGRITERHKSHLAQLNEMTGSLESASADG
ncbi:MAG: hypothetical protein IID41_16770 [Planctomycetes bacterium]|nr:hypothetical protein [Planctomycetota bacterium]MCH8965280.1 hypothetical protein [Planctomycetota bacterium]